MFIEKFLLSKSMTYGMANFIKPIGALSCQTIVCYDNEDDVTEQALSNTCYYEGMYLYCLHL